METALLYVAGAVLLGLAGVGVGVGVGVLGRAFWRASPASQNCCRCFAPSSSSSWVWWTPSRLSGSPSRSTSCLLSLAAKHETN